MPKNRKTKVRSNDRNLAVISVILGATSFFYLFFTGIPAIVLGIMALRRKVGNPAQAKLGIVFGTIGTLLIIPAGILVFVLLRQPVSEQYAINDTDQQQISQIGEALKRYKQRYGTFPQCPGLSGIDCADWQALYSERSDLAVYPTEFESESYNIEDRPAGTLVFAAKTTCFLSVPADPSIHDEEYRKVNPADYAALVYFHDQGRACHSVNDD